MTQAGVDNPEPESADDISALENFIQKQAPEDARRVLRRLLFSFLGQTEAGSIGDALASLALAPSRYSLAAVIFLRCLAVRGLVPEPNAANQIVRSTVELCEGALPDIISFLRLDKRAQNFEKFTILAGCHERIGQILSPFRSTYGDLDALLRASREIIGCLNHSIVRRYAEPFRLNEVRITVEKLVGKLKKVAALDTSLLLAIDDCNNFIAKVQLEIKVADSFLIFDYLSPFLATCNRVLAQFLESLRGRFATTILWAGTSTRQLQKRYPLHEPEREIQIVIPLRNSGPGMATDVRITTACGSDHLILGGETIILGNVLPGEFSVTLDAMIISGCSRVGALLSVEWGEIGNPIRKTEVFQFELVAQSASINWQSLEYMTPYSTGVAEGQDFVGRAEKVRLLAAKWLRQPMQSIYITGQKRVGKTSLALAAAKFAKEQSPSGCLDFHYILWGSIAHADPSISLKQLGESIEDFMVNSIPQVMNLPKVSYQGSLAGLIRIADLAVKVAPSRKFLLILDEFDEIHQELFLHGNLAQTFFGNLRALSRCRNVCIVLVGGENMPFIMDRQGQKLNNFSRINLSYFSRDTEWSDFQLLVKQPTQEILNWHDDAISEVFNVTNGNPYFAKIVCSGVFHSAVVGRDADITAAEVRQATEAEVSALGANSFAHLWQDGVPKAADEREPDILRRSKVLIAVGRCMRHNVRASQNNIADHRMSTNLSEGEITAVLNDFVRRDVLREETGQYNFVLPIFRLWLIDVGMSQVVADSLIEEMANAVLARENAALVRSDEVVALARTWPTYRGRHIGTDDIRAWYQQVESLRDQRLLFELLKRTRVISEAHVREQLQQAHGILRRSLPLPEFITRRKSDRRRDVLVTFVDGEGKSGASYASLYAEENGIAAECVVAPTEFSRRLTQHASEHGSPAAIVVVDDIAATGRSLSRNLTEFALEHAQAVKSIPIRALTLLATAAAQQTILMSLEKLDSIDIDFRTCQNIPSEMFAFPVDAKVWDNEEDEARAKAMCINVGAKIYKDQPLGYGNMGLLIVFPTTVPNNTLPILHTGARSGSGLTWVPLFPRVVN